MLRKILGYSLVLFALTLLVGCSQTQDKSDNNLDDYTYDELIDMAQLVYERDEEETNYDKELIYGDDMRANADIYLFDDGQYIKFVFYGDKADLTQSDKEIIYLDFEREYNNYTYLNKTSDMTSEEINNLSPDYVSKQGKIIKE